MRSTRVDDSCPYCKDRKLLRGYNDLATAYPELVAEWDFERNGDLGPRRHRLRQREESLVEMRAWARMTDIRLQQDRRRRPRLPLLRRPQGADRPQRFEDDAFQDREGVGQGAQRRPKADRRDRQLQQARLVEVQGGPRVVRPHSEPRRKGKADPGCPYCSRRKVLAGYNDLAASIPS